MRTIPSAVQTLLKSRSMIGANKPSYEVTVEGLAGGYDYDSLGTTWHTPVSGITDGGVTVADKADGSLIVCGIVSGYVYEGTVVDAATLLGANNTVTGWASAGIAITGQGRCHLFRADGDLWLSVSASGSATVNGTYKLYKSASGNGGDWILYSTVYSNASVDWNPYAGESAATAGAITVMGNGRYVLCGPCWHTDSGYNYQQLSIWTSDDKGLTWTLRYTASYGPVFHTYYVDASVEIAQLEDGTLFWGFSYNYGTTGFIDVMSSDGITWSDTPMSMGSMDYSGGSFCADGANNLFYLSQHYDGATIEIYQATDPKTVGTLTLAETTPNHLGRGFTHAAKIADDKAVIVTGTSILGFDIEITTLPVNSISISREKNSAGQLQIAIANTGGEWAPDGTVYPGILWPNKQIGLWQGYGAELVKTFTGTIDSIALSTFPQELTLNLRDHLKYALDQIITSGTSHVLTYTAQTIEAIVTDLVSKASMTAGTIHTTGITVATKTFSWCTYMDAISELAEICCFEFGCDEDGLFYFRKDSNVSPLAKGWTLTFTDGAAQTLYYPIITDSEVIYFGATVYIKDTDYTINYTTGAITSITIADGSVTMDYAYISYAFAEGEDIISLGYTLDDEAAYYKVAVYGQSATGSVVFASADFASRTYYNVLSQKFMKIDAGEAAQTVAECQALADQAIRLMESRIRICTFAAVAVPWLQVGDFIRVTETSSTISEIYRITDLSTSMDDSGYTMQITCFHHSA